MNEDRSSDADRRAAEWVARLDGRPLDDSEREAFRHWLEAHPDHRPAFEEAHRAWRSLDLLRHDPGPLRTVPRPARKTTVGRAGIAGVVALLVLGLLSLRYHVGDPWIALTADWRTAPGQTRQVTLADGSLVELGPDSAIVLHFGADERRVTLLSGEAFFHATPRDGKERRPFVVDAAHGTTTALGTQFLVEERPDGARVTAVEHRIEVALDTPERGVDRVVLSPGHTVQYDVSHGFGRVDTVDVAEATAWRTGLLVFDSVPLQDVVRKLNRYRRGRIVVASTQLAQRRVSGVFATSDLDDVIRTITAELGANASSLPPLVTVLY
ncbi:FecR domain-containing protein [Rhodoplanes sp. TEM]|uniref:FecR domain-containing protein n=1 Tax=Rhodoplanes tepidamans TaxID=200616 RepID=A0ABT5J894_RHOTP|nr:MULTISPECIES: FecR domain-containing protein [Rhodoplanes]MDC7785881.1 FecR domain-containing protein [Rhodoplanes tepidamans]MDC7984993.1 FecR domain-containing protein [Rhodoplanes sp. TEM]MDQ0355501.1 transmembrane sensor [Rhodoplanes tepidamans]